MSFLLPKGTVFFELFRKMRTDVENMSALFQEFVKNFDDFEDYMTRAHVIEKSADDTAHRIVDELNRSFITPFDREDIHYLVYELDDIVDRIEDIIRNIHLYHVVHKVDSMDEFAACISEATRQLGKMMTHLERLKHTPALTREKIRIHEIEDQADLLFENAMSRLFQNGNDPVEIVKTKDILEAMETVVDKYQAVGNLIEGIIIKMN